MHDDAMRAGTPRLDTASAVDGKMSANHLEADASRRSTGLRQVFLAGAFAVLALAYILTGPGNRTEADDAFWFAYDIESRSIRELMSSEHTAHLLFLPLARGLWNLTGLVGLGIRAYDAIRLANCFVAAASVVLFGYTLWSRLRLSSFAAITAATGLAFSYGFWRYANETEVYALSILIIVGLCWACFSGLHSVGSVVLTAVLAALGGLIHILGFIPTLVLIPVVLLLQRRLRDTAVYLVTVALLVGAVSYAAYRYAAPSPQGFVDYAFVDTGRASQGALTVPASALALAQDVATGNFLFAYPRVAQRLVTAFPAQYLNEEEYAGERSTSIVRFVPLATMPLLFLLIVAVLWTTWRHRAHAGLRNGFRPYLIAVSTWAAAYWVVVVVRRSSSAPEAWIPLLPAVWILLSAVVLERGRTRTSQILVVALLAVLLVHNLAGGLLMMRSHSADLNAVRSKWLLDHAVAGDLILTADGPVFGRYLRYYSRAQVIDLEGRSAAELAAIYDGAVHQRRRIFATAGVFDPPVQLRVVNPMSFQTIRGFAARIQPGFREVADDGFGTVYLRGY
jgi:hypothetical protein